MPCVIFDFGNVIAHFDHMRACRRLAAMSRTGLDPRAVFHAIFETDLEHLYDCGAISTAGFIGRLRRELGVEAGDQEIEDAWSDIFTGNPALYPTIDELDGAGVRLVLASNTNEMHYRRFSAQFEHVVTRFDDIVLSFRVGARKPEARFFEACIAAAGAGLDRCVYVDDRADFVSTARTHGLNALHYTGGSAAELVELARPGQN